MPGKFTFRFDSHYRGMRMMASTRELSTLLAALLGCTNTLRRPMETINEHVVSWILDQISPEWIAKAISEIKEARTKDFGSNHDALAALRKQESRLKREIDRLVPHLRLPRIRPKR